jgi:hypothetical protein
VVATADHNVPTTVGRAEKGIADPISRLQVETLDENAAKYHVKTYFGMKVDQLGDPVDQANAKGDIGAHRPERYTSWP